MENLSENYLIDSHCHLQFFKEDELDSVINNCIEMNMTHLLTNSTSIEDFKQTITISQKYSNKVSIIPGLGYHPWFILSYNLGIWRTLEKIGLKNSKNVVWNVLLSILLEKSE